MPLVEIKVVEGVFSESQKHEMIEKVTDAMVSIEGENLREHTIVIVEEVKSGDFGIGGHVMSTEDIEAIAERHIEMP